MINLRFHHLLCFLGFRGLGYGESFVENFKKIYTKVIFENTKINLILDPDEICKSCPNLINSMCKFEDKVKKLDTKLLEFLKKNGFTNFHNILPSEVYTILTKLSIEEFENICRDCEWFKLGYCKEGLINLKKQK